MVLRRAIQNAISQSIFGNPGAPVPPQQEREADPTLARLQFSGMWEAEEAHRCLPSARRHGVDG